MSKKEAPLKCPFYGMAEQCDCQASQDMPELPRRNKGWLKAAGIFLAIAGILAMVLVWG